MTAEPTHDGGARPRQRRAGRPAAAAAAPGRLARPGRGWRAARCPPRGAAGTSRLARSRPWSGRRTGPPRARQRSARRDPTGSGPAGSRRAVGRAPWTRRDSPRRPPAGGCRRGRSVTRSGTSPDPASRRSSQPAPSGSAYAEPRVGSHTEPAVISAGSATRLGIREPTAAARCPSPSTARASPLIRASTGAARARSRSSCSRRRSTSSMPVMRAASSTSASSAGCMPRDGPLTSTTPRVRPDHGSLSGAAAQPQGMCDSTKCSGPWMCTPSSRTRLVPMALVPTLASVQAEPPTKPSRSAR